MVSGSKKTSTPAEGDVDLVQVGQAMGYTNLMSVGNRFHLLRKRHGFPNLECTSTVPKDDEKLSAAPTKNTEKATPAAMSSNMADAGEEPALSPEEGEASVSVKAKDQPKKPGRRKGAKVSSSVPIAAGASTKRKGAGAPKAKGAAKGRKTRAATKNDDAEGINSYLLDAVDRVLQGEGGDVDMNSSD